MNKELQKRVLRRLTSGRTRKNEGSLIQLNTKDHHHAYCVMGVVARELGVKPKDMVGSNSLGDINGYGDLYEKSGITKNIESDLVQLNDDGVETDNDDNRRSTFRRDLAGFIRNI